MAYLGNDINNIHGNMMAAQKWHVKMGWGYGELIDAHPPTGGLTNSTTFFWVRYPFTFRRFTFIFSKPLKFNDLLRK